MSRIYFHSLDAEAEVRGFERGWGHIQASDLALSLLGVGSYPPAEELRRHAEFPPGHYMNTLPPEQYERSFRAAVGMSDDTVIRTPDGLDKFWLVAHNTACAAFSDPMVLLSRIHLTCEVHGWFPGEHRAWLADVIDQGLEERIMRDREGWASVAELARSSADGEIVMSYSVCEQFPNAWLCERSGTFDPGPYETGHIDPEWNWEVGEDDWADYRFRRLTPRDRWDAGLAAGIGNAITPLSLRARFGMGYSAFDLRESAAVSP